MGTHGSGVAGRKGVPVWKGRGCLPSRLRVWTKDFDLTPDVQDDTPLFLPSFRVALEEIVKTAVNQGVKQSSRHTQIGLHWRFNSNFSTSIPDFPRGGFLWAFPVCFYVVFLACLPCVQFQSLLSIWTRLFTALYLDVFLFGRWTHGWNRERTGHQRNWVRGRNLAFSFACVNREVYLYSPCVSSYACVSRCVPLSCSCHPNRHDW